MTTQQHITAIRHRLAVMRSTRSLSPDVRRLVLAAIKGSNETPATHRSVHSLAPHRRGPCACVGVVGNLD